MDCTATGPRAYIATRSNASAHPNGKSVGVAVDVLLVIEELDGCPSITLIARQAFHLPGSNIDVAERIGVLVGMDLILDSKYKIQDPIDNAGARLQPPIRLHFDRKCLEQTLPDCLAFNSLRTSLVGFLRENLVDQLYQDVVDQLDKDGGVVLCWEQRTSEFIQIIGSEAKKATQKKVCPMKCSFDPIFLNTLNMNGGSRIGIQQTSRSGHHMVQNRPPEEPASASRQMKHESNYFQTLD